MNTHTYAADGRPWNTEVSIYDCSCIVLQNHDLTFHKHSMFCFVFPPFSLQSVYGLRAAYIVIDLNGFTQNKAVFKTLFERTNKMQTVLRLFCHARTSLPSISVYRSIHHFMFENWPLNARKWTFCTHILSCRI